MSISARRTVTLKGEALTLADLKELVYQAVLRGLPDDSRATVLTGHGITITAPLEAPPEEGTFGGASAGSGPEETWEDIGPRRCPWCGSPDPLRRNPLHEPGLPECSHSFHDGPAK